MTNRIFSTQANNSLAFKTKEAEFGKVVDLEVLKQLEIEDQQNRIMLKRQGRFDPHFDNMPLKIRVNLDYNIKMRYNELFKQKVSDIDIGGILIYCHMYCCTTQVNAFYIVHCAL